jgi:serine/threonine-protein kinase
MDDLILNNRYRVLKPLGDGGFGTTYLAEDTQMPSHRRCVIKQLKPLHNNPQVYQMVKERFQREAAILEDLGDKSEQIPRLYAYCEEAGQFYLVQEYIEGDTLSQRLQREGKLTEASVKEILLKLLSVLAYVHRNGIVHRDIKPDNIIIRQTDELPILIDFGAVRETMGTAMSSSGHPTSSIVIGTPGFMPSEQSIGRPVFASDVYAVGLTAIYLLTGKTPQELTTDPLTGEIQWRQDALSISPTLATVLDKSIKSHYQERFSTAQAMRDALTASITSTTAKTLVVSPQENSTMVQPSSHQSSRNRNGWPLLIVGGIIGAILLGGFLLLQQQQQKAFEERLRELQESNSQPSSASPTTPIPNVSPIPSTPSPNPPLVTSPTPFPDNSPPTPEPYLSESDAISTIESLYYLLSTGQYNQAVLFFSPQLASQFDPQFFNQFERVTVENLQIQSRSNSVINFLGENTYVYPDGSTQRERRSYTVRLVEGDIKVTASEFIKVIKFR